MSSETTRAQRGRRERLAQISQQSTLLLLNVFVITERAELPPLVKKKRKEAYPVDSFGSHPVGAIL